MLNYFQLLPEPKKPGKYFIINPNKSFLRNFYISHPIIYNMVDPKIIKHIAIWIFIAIILVLSVLIIKPIFLSILLGFILAYAFYPVYAWVYKRTKRKNLSAILISILALLIIFIPLWFTASTLIKQIFDVYSTIQSLDLTSMIETVLPFFFANPDTAYNFNIALNNFVSNTASILMTKISEFIVDIPAILLQLFVTMFVFYYALRDGEIFKKYIRALFPFSAETKNKFFKRSTDITYSVIYGNIIVGLIQGIATGIGLFIAGVENALLLTIIAIFLSIIPIVGSWLIWVPAALFLFVLGNTGAAIFLLIYGFFFVSIIDNIIRPYLVSKKTKVPNSITLIGMIGGLLVFGILGLLVGPLVLAYLLIILELYKDNKIFDIFTAE